MQTVVTSLNCPPFSNELRTLLTGKQLLQDEVLTKFPQQVIDTHHQNGYLIYEPSIIIEKHTTRCMRCHNTQNSLFAKHHCARCQKICTYCRNCINMGKASSCSSIVKWMGPQKPRYSIPTQPVLIWTGILSKPQQHASQKLVQAIQTKTSTLVHAVCGAGKTEMLFEAIAYALTSQQRICIATPRRDVVKELYPRLQQAFATTKIEALYGGSDQRNDEAQLTIATTHQLYRYRHAFDVMIIDEVDAFPFSADDTLMQAAENARTPDSTRIFVTATPNKGMMQSVKKGELQYIHITARYHGHPLPEPTTKWIGNWKKTLDRKRLPCSFQKWLEPRIKNQRPILIFMPDIESMHKIESILQSKSTTTKLASVHAQDPDRTHKVQQMRNSEIQLLLTTTILERGVTFSKVEVAVFAAEKTIFTESALVQIAGRAGRDQHHPTGDVTFFHFGHTKAIIKARQHIQRMNREAKKGGWLKGDNQ